MKKFLILLSIMFCSVAFAHTIEWYVGDTLLSTTTCESGDNITPPTVPEKFGYSFRDWLEYRPIEYLESTGTQWIDTGVKPNQDTRAITSFVGTYTNTNDTITPFGARNGILSGSFFINLSPSRLMLDYDGQREQPQGNYSYLFNDIAYVDLNKNVLEMKNIKTGSSYTKTFNYSGFQTNYNLFISGLNSAGSSGGSKNIKIYYFQIYDKDVLVRDFIPVLDKDGTPCMYDRVERKYYYNAGTGDFIAGPVIGE